MNKKLFRRLEDEALSISAIAMLVVLLKKGHFSSFFEVEVFNFSSFWSTVIGLLAAIFFADIIIDRPLSKVWNRFSPVKTPNVFESHLRAAFSVFVAWLLLAAFFNPSGVPWLLSAAAAISISALFGAFIAVLLHLAVFGTLLEMANATESSEDAPLQKPEVETPKLSNQAVPFGIYVWPPIAMFFGIAFVLSGITIAAGSSESVPQLFIALAACGSITCVLLSFVCRFLCHHIRPLCARFISGSFQLRETVTYAIAMTGTLAFGAIGPLLSLADYQAPDEGMNYMVLSILLVTTMGLIASILFGYLSNRASGPGSSGSHSAMSEHELREVFT